MFYIHGSHFFERNSDIMTLKLYLCYDIMSNDTLICMLIRRLYRDTTYKASHASNSVTYVNILVYEYLRIQIFLRFL